MKEIDYCIQRLIAVFIRFKQQFVARAVNNL